MIRSLFYFSCLLLITSCATKKYIPYSSTSDQFIGRYAEFFEEGEVEVNSWYHYVTSKNAKGEYIVRTFFPETKKITSYTSYTSASPLIKHGLSVSYSDQGQKKAEGYYVNGQEAGIWKFFHGEKGVVTSEGNYEKGKKEGLWKKYDDQGRLSSHINYKNGLKEGEFIIYDTLQQVINKGIYQDDSIVEQSNPDTTEHVEELPFMYDCGIKGDMDEQRNCSTRKMLQYIYNNIKYPATARLYGIEGVAIVRFTIDTDGTIKDIKMLKGLCQDISDECINLVKGMPKWYQAGMQNGKKVEVGFNLPIKFKLQ